MPEPEREREGERVGRLADRGMRPHSASRHPQSGLAHANALGHALALGLALGFSMNPLVPSEVRGTR